MRRISLLVLIHAFLACSPVEKKTPELMDCLPQNTLAIVQVNDQNMVVNTLTNLTLLKNTLQVNTDLYQKAKTVIPQNFTPKSLLLFTPEGKAEIAATFLSKKPVTDTLPSSLSTDLEYNGIAIQIEAVEQGKLYSSEVNGILIRSSSQLIVENCIRNIQDQKTGIQEGEFYTLAKLGDENAPVTLLLHRDFKSALANTFPNVPLFPGLSDSWMAFDFNTAKAPFSLNGVGFINDSLPDNLGLLKGLQPLSLLTPEVAPQNFDGYLALAIEDYRTLEDNFKQYSRNKNIALQKIDFTLLSVADEIAWVDLNDQKALLVHLRNTENKASALFPDGEQRSVFRSIGIYQHKLPEDLLQFSASFASPVKVKFSAQLDDFILFAENETFLKQLIGNYLDGATLARDLNFKNAKMSLADESTFLWLGKTENLASQWKSNANTKAWESIKVQQYPIALLQGVSESGFVQMYFTLQINNPEQKKNSVAQQYTFTTDAPVKRAPQWVKNHRNKTMDIAIQDEKNVLYLFSNTGKLFWKKQLPGPIIGAIEQVDLYKNRRLQLAFRTPNRFMILDRNGKVVPPFDIKVDGTAPQHLSVFDYDLNRDYRFLLAQGKSVKMYDNRGRLVSGFQLKSINQPLQHPAKHIRIGTRDYILLQDVTGQVRLLSRQGKDRISLKSNLKTSDNPLFEYRSTFSGTTQSGDFFQIDTNGNVITQPLGLQTDHRIDMTSKSIVTLSENKLDIKGIPVLLPYGKYTPPKIHYLNNIIYVTLTDLDAQKVYAYYSSGLAVGGFPVYGSSSVDVSNSDDDNAIEMVVQSEPNSFLIYQIN